MDGRTSASPVDEAGEAMGSAVEAGVRVVSAVAGAAADLVGQATNAFDEAAGRPTFEAQADAVRAGAPGDGRPDTRADTVPPAKGTTPDGEWEDGDPPVARAEEYEQAGVVAQERPNPWLNPGRPPTEAAAGGGNAEGPPDGPSGPGAPDDPGEANHPDDPDDPDDSDDGGASSDHSWRRSFRPESAGSGGPDVGGTPADPGAPPRDDRDGDDEDRTDVERREVEIGGLELEPDVERMRGAAAARAMETQQADEAAREGRDREGTGRERGGRPGADQERDAPREPRAGDPEVARAAENVARSLSNVRDVNRAAVNRVRGVPDVTPEVVQALQRKLEQRRGPGLGKDMGLG
ncbi:hypothetical protein ABT298_30875 [Streptomyces sp. NPDC001034]|uniref:hypothetical protein n=1 Tax=Streptomyces sp. NPDC001034 TaxID=3154375 RepID=UPI0033283B61